ncbi:GTPase - sulfate adenylate transferase subunit 1-like protein [Sinorhizobium medicae]|nr:GTPase - sulfate adenylate transferase subunit 1-like protein [Sinorhizobium medicae]
MSVRPIREEFRCGERGKLSRGMGSIFFGRVAAYMAPSSNRRQDWTCRCVPNAFDRWGENNNQLELSIYWLTSTVSSRQTRSSVKEIVTRYRDHVTAKEGEAVFFVFAVRASRRNTLVDNKLATGDLIFVDGVTNATVEAPLIDFPLRRPRHQPLAGHGREQRRACSDAEAPCCPVIHQTFRRQHGDRKCTRQAPARRRQSHVSVRRRPLGPRGVAFTDADRVEDIGRVAERSSWWAFGADIAVPRQKAHGKRVAGEASSSEVLEDTPLEECARHGPKGLNERRLPADPECGRCLVLRSAR